MLCDGPGNFMNKQCISGEISYTGCLKSIDTMTIYLALSFSLSVCFERIFILFDMNLHGISVLSVPICTPGLGKSGTNSKVQAFPKTWRKMNK
jgi:hypothetical protein